MIDALIAYIQSIVVEYEALGVFIAILFTPIPSTIIITTAGFFLLPAYGTFWSVLLQSMLLIALPVALGVVLGTLVIYFLAYWGGKPIIQKSAKWFGFSWEDLEETKKKLSKGRSDELMLFVLWALPIVPGAPIAAFCGIIRYPLLKYILLTAGGVFLQSVILSLMGWQAGELYYVVTEEIAMIGNHFLIGFGLLVLIGIALLLYKKKVSPR